MEKSTVQKLMSLNSIIFNINLGIQVEGKLH